MLSTRSTARRAALRREVLCADLERFENGACLWRADETDDPAGETLGDDARGPAARDAAVRAALATALTDKQREVVEMHFFQGLSQGEIARRLGITQQVVQKRLYGAARGGRLVGGAVARLREVLSPWAGGARASAAHAR